MSVIITAVDGTSVPKLFKTIGSFVQLAAARAVVAATETSAVITFTQLKSVDGIVGLTVRTQSTGAIRTNVDMTVSISGNVVTLGEAGSFNIDADTCVIDMLVWGKSKLA